MMRWICGRAGAVGAARAAATKAWHARAVLALGLLACLLAGCGTAPAPTPTATIEPPTLAPAPSATATATFTPMPSRTPSPVSVSESGEATATWTPVPGNPIWSFWTFENVEFQLPVAWHKGDDGSASDSLYVGPDGDGRPQLSISIGKAPAGADSARFARERLGRLKSALRGFSLVESDSSSISGLPAERASYRYEALNPNAPPGNGGLMRGVAWYAVRGEASFAFEFSVDDRRFGALLPVFDDIAARASIRS